MTHKSLYLNQNDSFRPVLFSFTEKDYSTDLAILGVITETSDCHTDISLIARNQWYICLVHKNIHAFPYNLLPCMYILLSTQKRKHTIYYDHLQFTALDHPCVHSCKKGVSY